MGLESTAPTQADLSKAATMAEEGECVFVRKTGKRREEMRGVFGIEESSIRVGKIRTDPVLCFDWFWNAHFLKGNVLSWVINCVKGITEH